MAKKIDINWTEENELVRDALFAIMKAHDIYETMSPENKQRFDYLFEMMTEPEEIKPNVPSDPALPVPNA
jgi:hypothetical protein